MQTCIMGLVMYIIFVSDIPIDFMLDNIMKLFIDTVKFIDNNPTHFSPYSQLYTKDISMYLVISNKERHYINIKAFCYENHFAVPKLLPVSLVIANVCTSDKTNQINN